MNPEIPDPGTDEALQQGCTCPVNARGRGYMGQEGVFVYSVGCTLHYPEPPITPGEDD